MGIKTETGKVYWVAGEGPMIATSEVNRNGIVQMQTPLRYSYTAHTDKIFETTSEALESYRLQHKCLWPLATATDRWLKIQIQRLTNV